MEKIGNAVIHFSEMVVGQAELRNRAQVTTQSILTSTSTENGVTFPLKVLQWPVYSGFFGREEILKDLQTKFGLENFSQRESGDVQSVLLHGTGGVGKTQIARTLAHRNAVGFDAIFWVRSDTEVNITADFTKIAMSLNLPGARHDSYTGSWFIFARWLHEQESSPNGQSFSVPSNVALRICRQTLAHNLRQLRRYQGHISKYIPTTKGAVIITSRRHSFYRARRFQHLASQSF